MSPRAECVRTATRAQRILRKNAKCPIARDDGYAALAALILTAVLSLGLAAALSAAQTERIRSVRAFTAADRDEAMNEAIMRFSIDRLNGHDATPAAYRIRAFDVTVSGESEARKWAVATAGSLSQDALQRRSRALALADAQALAAQALAMQQAQGRMIGLPRNDCFRRLFSPYGRAQPGDGIPPAQAPRTGEVWRLRAESGPDVREVYARFMGDSRQPYAILSEETFPRLQEPTCAS